MKFPMPRARGFSLIELMISLTIGLIVVLVVGRIFLGSKQAFSSTEGLSRLQENARYAIALLSRELRSGMYHSDPREPGRCPAGALAGTCVAAFPVATTPALTGVEGGTTSVSITVGGTAASKTTGVADSFSVRFQGSATSTGNPAVTADPDNTVLNCIGTPIPYGNVEVNTFFIQNDSTNSNEPTLYCKTAAAATACTVGTNCYPLVPGVENMQILYGEDSGKDTLNPDGSVDRWVTASNVSAWDNVLSVRVSLLLRTADKLAQDVDPIKYVMAGQDVWPTDTTATGQTTNNVGVNDKRLRRMFTTVINLRNRVQ
jgi:type IV pilus assembly protein PilW